jgi:uncharacterized protein (TIGR01777 family)
MRVTVSGGSGLIGGHLVGALRARGDEVTVLSRSGAGGSIAWDPLGGPAPAAALDGADAVINVAGEPIAQRWTPAVREAIRLSRTTATANLIAGIAALQERPRVLVSASAVGYYGDRGDELLLEGSAPGDDFLAGVCSAWEAAALTAEPLGVRVCVLRTGVVLDRRGGALAKMLPAFRLGVGGPVAGGRQYISWIALRDLGDLYLAAIDDERYHGAFNASAPAAVRNVDFSRALGRALHRPAVAPLPGARARARVRARLAAGRARGRAQLIGATSINVPFGPAR